LIQTYSWDPALGPSVVETYVGETLCLAQSAGGFKRYALVWEDDTVTPVELDRGTRVAVPDARPEIRKDARRWLYEWGLTQTDDYDESDLIGRRVTFKDRDGAKQAGEIYATTRDYTGSILVMIDGVNETTIRPLRRVWFVDKRIPDKPKEIAERVVKEGAWWLPFGLFPLASL
jgi:hypothetical protein